MLQNYSAVSRELKCLFPFQNERLKKMQEIKQIQHAYDNANNNNNNNNNNNIVC